MMLTREREGGTMTVEFEGPMESQMDFNEVRDSADRFHRAGADAIQRALSRNSLTFIEAVRQEQGE
jgi:hypothetical protein